MRQPNLFSVKSMNNRKTRIIPNGINLDEFNKEKYNPYVILEELELNPSDVHFVTVARFSHEKNHFFLIDTFLEVSRIINNAHLTLVGDGELKAEIAEYVNQKGLKKKSHLQGIEAMFHPYYLLWITFCCLQGVKGMAQCL